MSTEQNALGTPGPSTGPVSGEPSLTIGANSLAQLMEAIESSHTRMEEKFAQFRSEVRLGQEEAAAKALKRARYEKPYSFKKKGNEAQALFNSKLDETLSQAQSDAASFATDPSAAPALRRVTEGLQKGRELIEERQKLIRLADRSEHGWGMVEEYTADYLAENSDDERRIEKAERAAERKAGKRRKRRATEIPATKPHGQQRGSALPPSSIFPQPQQPGYAPKRQLVPVGGRPVGPCHFCGEMGHLRLHCPARMAAEGRKWYPFQCETVSVELEDKVRCIGVNDCNGGVDRLSRDDTGDGAIAGISVNCVESGGESGKDAAWQQGIESEGCCNETPPAGLRYWEVGGDDPPMPVSVKGRLRASLPFWRDTLQASPMVLRVIESGYVLPLMSEPTQFHGENQPSAVQNAEFVGDSIAELVVGGCVRELMSAPVICSPLSVVESSGGKKRLVVNLRHLNRFLYKRKFKYEDLRVAMLLFKKGDYMFSFDLKSGYHHIDITEAHHKYLGFSWGGKFFAFTVLPFGLCTACYLFTKVMRPLVRYWRAQGLRVVMYLDDGVGAAPGLVAACTGSALVRSTLDKAGLLWHPIKSVWDPSQCLEWLGFTINLAEGQIHVPESKIAALRSMLQRVKHSPTIKVKCLASLLGKIISMSLAFGSVSRFMTRSLYSILEDRQSWYEALQFSPEAKAELLFWESNLENYNAQPIWHSPSAVRVVYSDASNSGFGGYVVEHGGCVSHGQWTAEEAQESSTWRELSAVYLVLASVAPKLANERVRWFTDNQNVVVILQVGSRKPALHEVALRVFSIAIEHQIRLEPEWVPRELNEKADFLSRIVDFDDWYLNPGVFAWLDSIWGPHTVDRFADSNNCQLARFNSRCWNPGSEAVDTFTTDWWGENNWWCPPVTLVPRAISHAEVCMAVGTLIVPEWPASPFWPLLHPSAEEFAWFVVHMQELPLSDSLFLPGLSGLTLFHGEMPNTRVFAVRCDFTQSRP